MGKHNVINASVGNPFIRDESEQGKYRELLTWLDSYTTYFEIYLFSDSVIMRFNGRRTFNYPKNVTMEWLQSKVKYMVENNI